MESIKVSQSLTIWLNVIVGVVAVLQHVLDLHVVPAEYTGYVLLAMTILNTLIRIFRTSKPIEL